MLLIRLLAVVTVLLACSLTGFGLAPAPFPGRERGPNLPVGNWTVHFENGVVETCEVKAGGTARVVEPNRNAGGKATVKGRAVLIVCEDGRLERWTRAEDRMIVEHWFPASAFPAGTPVRGVAQRAK